MEPEKSVDSSICSKSITVLENSNDSTFVKGQTSDSVTNKVLIEEQEEENEDNQITHENDARTSSISSQVNEEEVMNTNTAISRQETGSVVEENDRTPTHEASKVKEFHVINLSDVEEEEERVCRICHFGCNQTEVNWELIEIGCKCKNGLHLAHKHCAQLWFKLKGNRVCEICGGRAKNVKVGERREERERERELRREMEIGRREIEEEGEGERRSGSGCGGGEASCFWFFMLLIFLVLHWAFKKIDAMKTDPIIKL